MGTGFGLGIMPSLDDFLAYLGHSEGEAFHGVDGFGELAGEVGRCARMGEGGCVATIAVAVEASGVLVVAVEAKESVVDDADVFVCREIGVAAAVSLEVQSDADSVVGYAQHGEDGRSNVDLLRQSVDELRCDSSRSVEKQWHVVVGERHVVGVVDGCAMVGDEDKECVGEPGLF